MNTNPTYPRPLKSLPIDWEQVICLEGTGNYTTFILAAGNQLLTSKSICYYEPHLPMHFMRVHKSCVVNRNFVKGLDKTTKTVLLTTEIKIQVARRRWCDLKRFLATKS